jgi:hypothetical protein
VHHDPSNNTKHACSDALNGDIVARAASGVKKGGNRHYDQWKPFQSELRRLFNWKLNNGSTPNHES